MSKSLFDLLICAAKVRPDDIALRMSGRTMTYGQLQRRAAAVANYLRHRGLRRPDRVGILMERSFDSITAIFGVLGAGGVYVPLDSSASDERSTTMLRNADVRYLFTDSALAKQAISIADQNDQIGVVVGLGEGPSPAWEAIYAHGGDVPEFGLIENDLAVMFHTSGTTGIPKGVVHSHRSMLSVVEWAVEQFGLHSNDVFIGVTAHSFELSWFELFASFFARGEIVLAPEDCVKFSPSRLAALAAETKVSVWCSVPSLLMRLSERGDIDGCDLSSLRRINFAGERYPTQHLRRIMAQVPHVQFCNMLGTTETHICAFHELDKTLPDNIENIPVGKACAHVNLAAIGADGTPVPVGDVGQLVVRGPNLMAGYWRLPERTSQAVVDVRFGPDLIDKAYCTGDLVRQDDCGDFHIIGRADRRIKILGHLVDLDEVEAVILARDEVLEGAVFSVGDDGVEHIQAMVAPKTGRLASAPELRAFIANVLPIYAVPERIFVVEALPRLENGKISRRTVKEIGGSLSHSLITRAPSEGGAIDSLRHFIAEQILEDPAASIDDAVDLFDEGVLDSMAVMRVVNFIEQDLGVAVPNDEFVKDNFRSLNDMGGLVQRLEN